MLPFLPPSSSLHRLWKDSTLLRLLLPLGIAVLAVGCAHTDFSTYEGSPVYQGSGGSKKVVKGIDVWNYGTPPRKYRLIGIVDDRRGGGPVPMAFHMSALATQAQRQGGDAVIILDSAHQQVGTYFGPPATTATTSGQILQNQNVATFGAVTNSQAMPVVNMPLFVHVTRAAIIKYVP